MVTILTGDCRDVLKTLPDASVNCCVTSPPYWGLRDYGVDGQIGLEHTPEQYVAKMVAVFREVRRVLRDDGTLWLNLGSSYSAHPGQRKETDKAGPKQQTCRGSTACPSRSSGGTPANLSRQPARAPAYDTDGTILQDSQGADRVCPGSDDGCQGEIRSRHAGTVRSVQSSPQDEPPTSRTSRDSERSDSASLTPGASLPGVPASTMPQSSCRPLGVSGPEATASACLSTPPTFLPDALPSVRNSCDDSFGLTSLYSTMCNTEYKPKDLVPIPWLVAMALQADGWYLRSDIIWHKPNPMPESVTDRPTRAHEYVFLLSKSERYYYDKDAIAEPAICDDIKKFTDNGHDKQRGHGRRHAGFNGRYAERLETSGPPTTRNKRSVWTVATRPYKEAHFATFPPDLIRPCVLAGCPQGGTVLDPFGGSGTTSEVAEEEGRNSILIELNPKYVELANKRTAQRGLLCVA